MSKKIYKIQHDWWNCKVAIEDTDDARLHMQEMVLFWSGGQRLIDSAGGVEAAWLKMFAEKAIILSQDYNLKGLIEEFKDMEGWYPLDGSVGIEILECDEWEFDDDEWEFDGDDFFIGQVAA